MESRSLVMQWVSRNSIALLSGTQCSKVLCSFRSDIRVQLHDDPAKLLIALFYIKENVGIIALGIGYQHPFLIVVHANLAKDSSKLRLLLLLCLSIFYLQLLDGLANILVFLVNSVSCHQIFLGILQFPNMHLCQSPSIKNFNIGIGLIGGFVEYLVAAIDGPGPILSFNMTHSCVSPAFNIYIILFVGERFVTSIIIYKVGCLRVQLCRSYVISRHELFCALFFQFGCRFHTFLWRHLGFVLHFLLKSKQLNIKIKVGVRRNSSTHRLTSIPTITPNG
mmetsp:Transcript_294/g.534  ORF Transcript_294/g.534 Transcript_294/m.534 type:complete len:279 (+) Transcript_294:507-1343(+)